MRAGGAVSTKKSAAFLMSAQEPPSWIYGYQHHKNEIWYDNDMAVGDSYVECDEDESKKCSESTVNLNPLDHQSYYNVKVVFANDGCKGYNPYKN